MPWFVFFPKWARIVNRLKDETFVRFIYVVINCVLMFIWFPILCYLNQAVLHPSVFVILSVVYVMLYANAVPSYSQNRFVCLWYQIHCAVSTEKSCIYHKGYILSTQLCQLFTYNIYLISNILVIIFYLDKEPQNTKMYI